MRNLKLIFAGLIGLNLVACGNPSPQVMPRSQQFKAETESFPAVESSINPRVDILFVIDNSHSMTTHQKRLSENIDSFVKNFARQDFIDFHIGVTSVYDTRKFSTDEYKTRYPGKPNYRNGELRPVSGSSVGDARYITNQTDNLIESLEKTLLIGTVAPNKGGPRWEESFSPVVAAFSDGDLARGANSGFRREIAHKAVIFVTDAEDQSLDMSVSQFNAYLKGLVPPDSQLKVATYGVISPSNEPHCNKDYDVRPEDAENPVRVEELLAVSGGMMLSLCQADFGETLAEIGNDLWEKVTTRRLKLRNGRPDFNKPFVVYLGGKELSVELWSYEPHSASVIVRMDPSLSANIDEPITVSYTQVEYVNIQNGNTRRYGKNR